MPQLCEPNNQLGCTSLTHAEHRGKVIPIALHTIHYQNISLLSMCRRALTLVWHFAKRALTFVWHFNLMHCGDNGKPLS